MQTVTQASENQAITLPRPNPPAGNYRPVMVHQGWVAISGQTPKQDGELVYRGKVGRDLDEPEAIEAARLCGLNLLSQLHKACEGNWDNLLQCMKLTVFVNCTDTFDRMPQIADGVSNLLVELLGDKGLHSRAAVGVASLPGGAAVEVDGLFIVRAD